MLRRFVIAVLCVTFAGCGDSISRRQSAAAELLAFAATFRSNPDDLTPLNSIVDVLERGKYGFGRTFVGRLATTYNRCVCFGKHDHTGQNPGDMLLASR